MKNIISMILAMMVVFGCIGCAEKSAGSARTPSTPSTSTEAPAQSRPRAYDTVDKLVRESLGSFTTVDTSWDGSRYYVAVVLDGFTTSDMYKSGLAEQYRELSYNIYNALGADTVIGIMDSYGNIIYWVTNGIDITGKLG